MTTQSDLQFDTAAELTAKLNEGQQPDDIAGYVFTAIGAAGVQAPFGPGTGVFRDDLAKAIADWAVAGINALVSVPRETSAG